MKNRESRTVEQVNAAHFLRLRAIDRAYDTGRIDYDEMVRRERDEERRYDRELDAKKRGGGKER